MGKVVASGRNVVVIGGAGFIGSHLCEALLARGDAVSCVDNLVATARSPRNVSHLLSDPRFELLEIDLLRWPAPGALSGVDVVFNLAASKNVVSWRDPERDLAVNALGVLRLTLALARAGVPKLVHFSTGSVFGESDLPHDEQTPMRPVSIYGTSKLAGESYCRVVGDANDLDYTILRPYHVIGPRQDDSESGGVLPIFVRQCLDQAPLTIYGTGGQTRSFTSVHDVVASALLVAEDPRASRQAFNCASGVSVTIEELAEFLAAETSSSSSIDHAPARPGDIVHFAVDNHKLRGLGIEFDLDWQACAREVIAFARERPPVIRDYARLRSKPRKSAASRTAG